jgi:hypothetical protein
VDTEKGVEMKRPIIYSTKDNSSALIFVDLVMGSNFSFSLRLLECHSISRLELLHKAT